MQVPALNEQILSPYLNNEEIFKACILQTEKDLHAYGIQLPLNIPGAYPLGELLHALKPQIARLLQQGNPISDLLYRVDIAEPLLHKALNELKEAAPDELISRLIILRELQKVVTRMNQANNHDQSDFWLE